MVIASGPDVNRRAGLRYSQERMGAEPPGVVADVPSYAGRQSPQESPPPANGFFSNPHAGKPWLNIRAGRRSYWPRHPGEMHTRPAGGQPRLEFASHAGHNAGEK